MLRPSPLRGLATSPRALMARVAAYLFGAGGTIAVLILVLPHAPRLDETAFVALGAIAYALAALMAIANMAAWRERRRARRLERRAARLAAAQPAE